MDPPTDNTKSSVPEEFLASVSRDFARDHLLVCTGVTDEEVTLHIAESTSPFAAFNVGVAMGRRVLTQEDDPEQIAARIDQAYGEYRSEEVDSGADSEPRDLDRLMRTAERDLLNTEGKGPLVRLVDAILFDALRRHASDVHVEPMAENTLIRYRLDGVLHTVREVPRELARAITSRIKVMARLDIAEQRVPQDGRASVTIGRAPVDLRISTLPTTFGERTVMRLLDKSRNSGLLSLRALGMPSQTEHRFLERCSRSSGIVLVTGPTGSGKTTTLYATLRWLADEQSGERNIMTIENPVEYELSGLGIAISQSQVNLAKGVTFATGLKHLLRQDPDVIMVGEIRDSETARVAIQASLTGHLVFSTLHTNDAASAVTRLIDLEIQPYLIAASLSAVLAQRLARTFHDACQGTGCEACAHSGFAGRLGVFELLVVDDQIRELITTQASTSDLRCAASDRGMVLLRNAGQALVADGRTRLSEIERVIQGAND